MSYTVNRNRTAKQLDGTTKSLVTKIGKLNDSLHVHLCECIAHVVQLGSDDKVIGDVGPLERLVKALPISVRTETIRLWIGKYTPITKTGKDAAEVWHLKRGWTVEMFKLDELEANPFWSLGKEKTPTPLTIAQFMGMLKGMSEKVDRKVKTTEETGEVHFRGDPNFAKNFFNKLLQVATEETKAVSPETIGEEVKSNVIQLHPTAANDNQITDDNPQVKEVQAA